MARLNRSCVVLVVASVLGVFVLGSGCPGSPLVSQSVTLAAEGGNAEVTFNGTAGQTIRITITGTPTTMEPYGILHSPTGTPTDAPPNGTATNGTDQATVTLTETGQYSYVVFDGANIGGSVVVLIEVISGT